MKKILLVSHCLLNTASKLKSYDKSEMKAEDGLRKEIIKTALDNDIHLLQLPCPEFLQYGYRRWGHTYDQFNNVFFRERCREMLKPIILQVKEYLENDSEFEIVGVLGIDGSPSCGVKYTCRAPWGGEFSGRDVTDVLHACHLEEGSGVLMETLKKMLDEEGITLKMEGLFAPEADRALTMVSK